MLDLSFVDIYLLIPLKDDAGIMEYPFKYQISSSYEKSAILDCQSWDLISFLPWLITIQWGPGHTRFNLQRTHTTMIIFKTAAKEIVLCYSTRTIILCIDDTCENLRTWQANNKKDIKTTPLSLQKYVDAVMSLFFHIFKEIDWSMTCWILKVNIF